MTTVVNRPAGQRVKLSAFERHQKLVSDYLRYYGGTAKEAAASAEPAPVQVRTDHDVLKDTYRFIRSEEDDAKGGREVRLAVKYYERLFREYSIADLSLFKECKVGMRWRTQAEVIAGKGQFICGAKGCDAKEGLCSYEVNFVYIEAGERCQALVKLRICPACGYKLNYKKEKQYRKAAAISATAAQHSRKRGRGEEVSEGGLEKDAGSAAAATSTSKHMLHSDEDQLQQQQLKGSGWDPDSFAPSRPAALPQGATRLPAVFASSVEQADAATDAAVLPGDDSIWESKSKVEESTAEEEINEYFTGLFD